MNTVTGILSDQEMLWARGWELVQSRMPNCYLITRSPQGEINLVGNGRIGRIFRLEIGLNPDQYGFSCNLETFSGSLVLYDGGMVKESWFAWLNDSRKKSISSKHDAVNFQLIAFVEPKTEIDCKEKAYRKCPALYARFDTTEEENLLAAISFGQKAAFSDLCWYEANRMHRKSTSTFLPANHLDEGGDENECRDLYKSERRFFE